MSYSAISERFITVDGLDSTGKGTLLKAVEEITDFRIYKTPPESMQCLRRKIDVKDIKLRFIYYVLGNIITNFEITKTLSLQNSSQILLDRSFLTTLSAHEVRGLPEFWLRLGKNIAQQCLIPRFAIILHVDERERIKRLLARGNNTKADFENLKWPIKMEQCYYSWAKSLGWKTQMFDNTTFTPQESASHFIKLLDTYK